MTTHDNRILEEKTFELGGLKTLISQNHYEEARFWSIYDRERWERVKRRMDPENVFRGLYEKFHFGREAPREDAHEEGGHPARAGFSGR